MENVIFINGADMPSDIKGKTWRQKNSEMVHAYKVGDLVELESGARLFIVKLTRDCDQTPLYSLCHDKDDIIVEKQGFGNMKWDNGWDEDSLKLIPMEE